MNLLAKQRRRYDVEVRVEVVVLVEAVEADDARDAAHQAASRALDSLEGHREKPRVVSHEIISSHRSRRFSSSESSSSGAT